MDDDTGVTSASMYKLFCSIGDGVFSHERLVRFRDAFGEDYTALVDATLVHADGDRTWFGVAGTRTAGGKTLVALPTDGSRVWVSSDVLEGVS